MTKRTYQFERGVSIRGSLLQGRIRAALRATIHRADIPLHLSTWKRIIPRLALVQQIVAPAVFATHLKTWDDDFESQGLR